MRVSFVCHSDIHAAVAGEDFHGGFVALDGNQALVGLDKVAYFETESQVSSAVSFGCAAKADIRKDFLSEQYDGKNLTFRLAANPSTTAELCRPLVPTNTSVFAHSGQRTWSHSSPQCAIQSTRFLIGCLGVHPPTRGLTRRSGQVIAKSPGATKPSFHWAFSIPRLATLSAGQASITSIGPIGLEILVTGLARRSAVKV